MVFTVASSLGLLNFYVYYVEDDLEINIFRSYQFRNVFRFKNTAFVTLRDTKIQTCLVEKMYLFMILLV